MTLNLSTPFFSSRLFPHHHSSSSSSSSVLAKFSKTCPNNNASFPTLSLLAFKLPFPPRPLKAKASVSESRNETSSDDTVSGTDQFDQQLLGVSPGDEVPFGKIVRMRCPSCRIAVAVAQPQQGIQEFFTHDHDRNSSSYSRRLIIITSLSFLAAATVIAASVATAADAIREPETLSNIPQTLSSGDCKKPKIQKPKSRKAESCTVKCVNTCIRGGEGEGPLNVRRPLVVFKQGFRSRQYCLVECSDICNLIGDADDGP